MTLQELIRQIESNLIDTIVDNGVNIEELSGTSEARDNLRQLLQGAVTEAVQERIDVTPNVSRFVSDVTVRATDVINTQLQNVENITLTVNEIKDTIQNAFETFAGDGRILRLLNEMRQNLQGEGVIQPSDIDGTSVGRGSRERQTFEEVLDYFINLANDTGEKELLDVYEFITNNTDIKELIGDNSQRIDYFNEFLLDVEIYRSHLYGENMTLKAGMNRTFDEEFVEVLQKYAKDKGMVLELDIVRGFDTVHNQGSRINRESVSPNYEANLSNKNRTTKIYFPEETDKVAKRVQDFITEKTNLFSNNQNIRLAEITPDGPMFTTNVRNHELYGEHLNRTFYSNRELDAFFDTQDVKVIMIGGSIKGSGAKNNISPLYKGGIKK